MGGTCVNGKTTHGVKALKGEMDQNQREGSVGKKAGSLNPVETK